MRPYLSRRSLPIAAAGVLLAALALTPPATAAPAAPAAQAPAASTAAKAKPSCATAARLLCAEVEDNDAAFGEQYVGHDEPSLLFYSNQAGAGNSLQYQLTLPRDPAPNPIPGRSYNFMLHPALWFGMAMCDSQSYPQQVSTCTPDSDSNITPLARHAGTAFMELQFYAPGYVKQFTGFGCDAKQWCAALTVDSLSEDPVNGTLLNPTCQSQVLGGVEYTNFAYVTRSGTPQASPNPLNFDVVAAGEPMKGKTLFMNQGDRIQLTMHDTAHGLRVQIDDLTTHQSGSMTASAANGFSQIAAAPTGTSCSSIPYDFHPMYSTSSPETRVPWAAHSYNIAFSDEIGHFDFCTAVDGPTGTCAGLEGPPGDQEPADGDDNACFTPAASTLVPVTGCLDSNVGFDGTSYIRDWPDRNRFLHPEPWIFSSPRTGPRLRDNYQRVAFESDAPRIEAPDFGGSCNRTTGAGCTIVPVTDDGAPATYYPFYTSTGKKEGCQWVWGSHVPGLSKVDFGGVSQYGTLLGNTYLVFGGGGAIQTTFNDFRQILPNNPCRS